MSLMQWLDQLDKNCFTFIHAGFANPLLDKLMLQLREPLTWIPLYVCILVWILRRDRKHAIKFILITIVCFAFIDFTTSSILKPLFNRSRPCFDESLQPVIRNIIGCGGRLSFPSNHAANHFGLAAFWYWSVLLITGKRWRWLWFWAFIICFAQVYVGKHYPLDVLAGGVYGMIIGSLAAKIFENWTGLVIKPSRQQFAH